MPPKARYTPTEILEAYQRNGSNIAATARALDMAPPTVSYHLDKIKPDNLEQSKDVEIRSLRQALVGERKRNLTDERILQTVFKLADTPVSSPDWIAKPGKQVAGFAGVPILFASDWHWGEVVHAAEIGGINSYNIKIANARARTLITATIDLLRNYIQTPSYPGIVLILGGDMMSGDIHDELRETNEIESMPSLLDLVGVLTWAVRELADEFGKVFVPCVTGNHGRMTRKPRMKRRNFTNFDWLLYQILKRNFTGDKRVHFEIPEGADVGFKVYGTRYLLTHGDQYRGGDGIIGPIGPIARGDNKKRARNMRVDLGYDVQLMGHHHQYIHLNNFIVNGSLKGYDEYAFAGNFSAEVAQQALWITHPDRGITFRMPVYVEPKREKGTRTWVSWAG